jgi:hypothetical protein
MEEILVAFLAVATKKGGILSPCILEVADLATEMTAIAEAL